MSLWSDPSLFLQATMLAFDPIYSGSADFFSPDFSILNHSCHAQLVTRVSKVVFTNFEKMRYLNLAFLRGFYHITPRIAVGVLVHGEDRFRRTIDLEE